MRGQSFIDRFANIYVILLFVGFLFIGTMPKILGLSEASLTVQFRVLILVLSLCFILGAIFSSRISKINLQPIILFLIFWFVYSVRVINDLFLYPIILFPFKNSSEYFQFTFGVTLIPAFALFLVIQTYKINLSWILKWLYNMLFLILILSLIYRSGSDVEGRNAGDMDVGILLFGQYGATLSILSFFLIVIKKKNVFTYLYYISGFFVGLSGIFVSASKSPFLALIVIIIIFFVFWYRSFKSALVLGIVCIFLGFYFIDIITFFSEYFKSNFVNRLLYAINTGNDEARANLAVTAFNEFLNNPLLGNAMLIQQKGLEGSYPHNLIIESLMATGVLGAIIFLSWIFKCLVSSVIILKRNLEIAWIGLVFLQYLIFGMFSKNLYANDSFWLFSVFLITIVSKLGLFKKNYNEISKI
jgi:hypothetical protein